jgi:ATP-dependent DNA ligase
MTTTDIEDAWDSIHEALPTMGSRPAVLRPRSRPLVPSAWMLEVLPQLVGNRGLAGPSAAIAKPQRFAIEPKVDGVRGLLAFLPDGTMETRNRRGIRRDWLRGDSFETGLRRLAQRLPILWEGTVLDGELIASRFAGTMAALHGSRRYRDKLRFVAFDVPYLAGADLRTIPWQDRRERLELLAQAFAPPYLLSPRLTRQSPRQ